MVITYITAILFYTPINVFTLPSLVEAAIPVPPIPDTNAMYYCALVFVLVISCFPFPLLIIKTDLQAFQPPCPTLGRNLVTKRKM